MRLTRSSWSPYSLAMGNDTIGFDEEEMPREHMLSQEAYEAARRHFFTVEPQPLCEDDHPLPSREELHDRPGLRHQGNGRHPV